MGYVVGFWTAKVDSRGAVVDGECDKSVCLKHVNSVK